MDTSEFSFICGYVMVYVSMNGLRNEIPMIDLLDELPQGMYKFPELPWSYGCVQIDVL